VSPSRSEGRPDVSTVDVTDVMWRKSSYSGGGNGNSCVELANVADVTAVRDSKNPSGPVLTLPSVTWRGFLRGLSA
jgi:Domain of unknown function (DUF397)